MSKIITINSVDIEAYVKAVEDYNKLPKKDRTSWLDLRKGYKKPFDEPVLYQSYYEDIDSDLETYTLQIVPEWASSSDSIRLREQIKRDFLISISLCPFSLIVR